MKGKLCKHPALEQNKTKKRERESEIKRQLIHELTAAETAG